MTTLQPTAVAAPNLLSGLTATNAQAVKKPTTLSTSVAAVLPSVAPPKTATLSLLNAANKPAEAVADPNKKDDQSKAMQISQLENYLNIWAVEVKDLESTFHEQVGEINNWDKTLTSNGDKLRGLHDTIKKLKEAQANINYDLDFVACHITELNDYLTDLEKKTEQNKNFCLSSKVDQQRNQLFEYVSSLDVDTKRLHEDLNELIESMNQTSSLNEMVNPVTQIGSILNSHVASLQFIDKNMEKAQSYLSELTAIKESICLNEQ